MSLKIIKAGLLDTIQDTGRYGYQHLGINPAGAADRFAARLANALLGRELDAAVLELYFPAAQVNFERPAIICISGADLVPTANGQPLAINQPHFISSGTELRFTGLAAGAVAYMAVLNGLRTERWLNSHSTHLKAGVGGFKGRRLLQGDCIEFEEQLSLQVQGHMLVSLPWKEEVEYRKEHFRFIEGPEWETLTEESKECFQSAPFTISRDSDRMGFRLQGAALTSNTQQEQVSSAVGFGTVQLLPSGQLVVLMADHQTTGGYPRLAAVIAADLPALAQKRPGEVVYFRATTRLEAEESLLRVEQYLRRVQSSSKLKLENWLHGA